MSTIIVCPCVAAWSSASRSAAARVMSISSGTLTTCTPRTIWIGYVTSVICVLPCRTLGPGSTSAFVLQALCCWLALGNEQGDIVAGGLAAHQGCHDRSAGSLWRLCRDRLTEPGQAIIDCLARAFDQPIGVKTQQGAWRYRHGGYLPSRIRGDADHQPCWDISHFSGLPRAGDDWGEMTGQ